MTHTPLKINDDKDSAYVLLPMPPVGEGKAYEMEIYARFMRHLRHVPNCPMEIKVLSAIQFVSDMLDHSEAHVAKLLVDLGLRGPRKAFPASYLTFADHALVQGDWEVQGASAALKRLQNFWISIGEDQSSRVQRGVALREAEESMAQG